MLRLDGIAAAIKVNVLFPKLSVSVIIPVTLSKTAVQILTSHVHQNTNTVSFNNDNGTSIIIIILQPVLMVRFKSVEARFSCAQMEHLITSAAFQVRNMQEISLCDRQLCTYYTCRTKYHEH